MSTRLLQPVRGNLADTHVRSSKLNAQIKVKHLTHHIFWFIHKAMFYYRTRAPNAKNRHNRKLERISCTFPSEDYKNIHKDEYHYRHAEPIRPFPRQ